MYLNLNGSMKNRFKLLNRALIIIGLIFIYSCNSKEKNIDYNEVVFKNDSFKNELNNFIKETELSRKYLDKSIILMLYINQDSDTIISITNFKPYESVNLVAANSYEKYKLYFYVPQNLLVTLNEFIDVKNGSIQNVSLEPIDESRIDPIHSYSFSIKNKTITP